MRYSWLRGFLRLLGVLLNSMPSHAFQTYSQRFSQTCPQLWRKKRIPSPPKAHLNTCGLGYGLWALAQMAASHPAAPILCALSYGQAIVSILLCSLHKFMTESTFSQSLTLKTKIISSRTINSSLVNLLLMPIKIGHNGEKTCSKKQTHFCLEILVLSSQTECPHLSGYDWNSSATTDSFSFICSLHSLPFLFLPLLLSTSFFPIPILSDYISHRT